MATIAFAIFYGNYMFAPLIPAFSHEFAVPASQLGWVIPGYLIPYGVSTLVYGALSDWLGRAPTLVALLCFAATTMMMLSFAGSWRALIATRILLGVGCGGIVCGDAAMNVAVNLYLQVPPGFLDKMADTMTCLRKLKRKGKHTLPTHDPDVFCKYPIRTASLRGQACWHSQTNRRRN